MGLRSKQPLVLTTDRWESLDTIFVIQSLFKGTVIDFDDVGMDFGGGTYADDYEKE